MSFGTDFKTIRSRYGITQLEASEVLGLSKSTIEKWEGKQHVPTTIMQRAAIRELIRYGEARKQHGGRNDDSRQPS